MVYVPAEAGAYFYSGILNSKGLSLDRVLEL